MPTRSESALATQAKRHYGISVEELDSLLASGLKPCCRCKRTKKVDEFGTDRSRRTGINPRCRPCCVEHTAEQRHRNPNLQKARRAEGRRRQLKKAGTTLEQYDELVVAQCGTCACCGELPAGYSNDGRLVPHHCHKTGRFIALICAACNLGMGKFRDDPVLMRRAAELNEAD